MDLGISRMDRVPFQAVVCMRCLSVSERNHRIQSTKGTMVLVRLDLCEWNIQIKIKVIIHIALCL